MSLLYLFLAVAFRERMPAGTECRDELDERIEDRQNPDKAQAVMNLREGRAIGPEVA